MPVVAIVPSTVGFHWEEVFDAYKVFRDNNWKIEFYTADGKPPTVDPKSVENHLLLSFLGLGVRDSFSPESELGEALMNELKYVRPIEDVNVKEQDAIYLPGGHGCLFDVNVNETLHQKLAEAFKRNKIIAAVCHATSALAFAKRDDGKSIIFGKKVIGFLDLQDRLLLKLNMVDKCFLPLPYWNERKMQEEGGVIGVTEKLHGLLDPTYHVVDLPLITGVGPKSVTFVIRHVVSAVNKKLKEKEPQV